MRLRSLLAALALAASSLAAHADSITFNLSFGTSTSAFSGSGVLTASTLGAGEYLITSVSGTAQDGDGVEQAISIEAPGTYPTATNGGFTPPNDNDLLDIGGQYSFDGSGLSFKLVDGSQINLSDSSSELLTRASGTDVIETTPINIAAQQPPIAVTPEPSSIALLGTGMLGMAGLLRKRYMGA